MEHTVSSADEAIMMEAIDKWIAKKVAPVEFVKGLISMRSDKVVLPYAKMATVHPRRAVFFATINPDETSGYLTDNTGNRRYWPVTATAVNIAGIRQHRDQLWAEAVELYRNKERWWLEPNEDAVARDAQKEREESDPWTEPLRKRIEKENNEGRSCAELTADDALTLLGITHDRKDRKAEMRICKALDALGYKKGKQKRLPGSNQRIRPWVRS